MKRPNLVAAINELLNIDSFQDYCPNGIQVEGSSEIKSVATAVTASLYAIESALELGADTLLVHHGLFWNGDDYRVVGPKQRRLKVLLENNINLIAYHLPLDAHPELGNNAQWAQQLGATTEGTLAVAELVQYGKLTTPLLVAELADKVAAGLNGRKPLIIDGRVGDRESKKIENIGWCSGGAEGYIVEAAEAGLDAYLTGEVSEKTYHEALEREILFFSCGHHATERSGVQALGKWLENKFDLQHQFIDENNPV